MNRATRIIILLSSLLVLVVIMIIIGNFRKEDPIEPLFVNRTQIDQTTTPPSTETTQEWGSWSSPDGTPMVAGTPLPTPLLTAIPTTATPTVQPTIKPTATPAPNILSSGDSGESVRYVQQRLKDLGYLSGKVDGDFGSATEEAIKAFQSENGLSADGVVGTRTMEKLKSSSAKAKPKKAPASATSVPNPKSYTPSELSTYRYLQLGGSGKDVTKLQNRLIELGYLDKKATGIYDEDTQAAVLAFQSRNGQWVDGVAGEDTQKALFSDKALPAGRD